MVGIILFWNLVSILKLIVISYFFESFFEILGGKFILENCIELILGRECFLLFEDILFFENCKIEVLFCWEVFFYLCKYIVSIVFNGSK